MLSSEMRFLFQNAKLGEVDFDTASTGAEIMNLAVLHGLAERLPCSAPAKNQYPCNSSQI